MASRRWPTNAVLALLLLAFLSGCGKPEQGTEATVSDKTRIALILPSASEDLAWSHGMLVGARSAQEELGQDRIELAVEEDLPSPIDAAASMEYYAGQGFDLIIAHGSQYKDTVIQLAARFPDVSFAYGPGSDTAGNVFAYDPQAQEGGYLLGTLAGLMTRTNKIGLVGTVESDDSIKYVQGFLLGVASVNADAEVLTGYTGSFGNASAAAALANDYADSGADFLTGTALQSQGAVEAGANRGLPWLASDMGRSSSWPEAVMAGQVYHWKDVVAYLAGACAGGIRGGEHVLLTFGNGRLSLSYADSAQVPDDVRSAVEEKLQAITDGFLVVE